MIFGGMDGLLYLVPVVLAITALRALPGIFRTERYAADEAFHIYLADEIRQKGHRILNKYNTLIPQTVIHYPSHVHCTPEGLGINCCLEDTQQIHTGSVAGSTNSLRAADSRIGI